MFIAVIQFYNVYQWNRSNTILVWYTNVYYYYYYSGSCKNRKVKKHYRIIDEAKLTITKLQLHIYNLIIKKKIVYRYISLYNILKIKYK